MKRWGWLAGAVALLVLSIVAATALGSSNLALGKTFGILADALGIAGGTFEPWEQVIVIDVRLPRVLLAAVGGAALASAGAVMRTDTSARCAQRWICSSQRRAPLEPNGAIALANAATLTKRRSASLRRHSMTAAPSSSGRSGSVSWIGIGSFSKTAACSSATEPPRKGVVSVSSS